MKLKDYLKDKYILFKLTNKGYQYWNPGAVGYTEQLTEAGVFPLESVKTFNLRILALCEVKAGRHYKYTHFAMTVDDAIKATS